MEVHCARFSGGATSAVKGRRICGVTEMKPMIKLKASNPSRLVVVANPIENSEPIIHSNKMSGRRLTRSPRGETSSRAPA